VVLRNVHIGADAVVDRCVIDDDTVIGAGALVGHGEDEAPNRQLPDVLNTGLTLIGLNTHVPPGYKIGRNVQVHSRTDADEFPSEGEVVSGDIVGRDPRRRGEPTDV
jgi:glucose-1-phosphate adenylyltransferase